MRGYRANVSSRGAFLLDEINCPDAGDTQLQRRIQIKSCSSEANEPSAWLNSAVRLRSVRTGLDRAECRVFLAASRRPDNSVSVGRPSRANRILARTRASIGRCLTLPHDADEPVDEQNGLSLFDSEMAVDSFLVFPAITQQPLDERRACFIEAARIRTARRGDRCKWSEVLAAETEEGPATG